MKKMRKCILCAAIAMLSPFLQDASCAQEGAQRVDATAATGPSLRVVRAQRFIDMRVQNRQGENVGEVEDVAIDTANGNIAYVALDAGLLGPLLAVPWKALRVAEDQSTVTMDVTKEALQKAPAFRREHWPHTVEPEWLAGVYSYYGYPPYPGLTEITVRHVRIARATTLLGLKVRNPQREELGDIEDVLIDVREGHIAYLILGTGGVLGIGETIRAVPWKAIRVEPVERVVLNIEPETLHNAPPLEEGAWGESPSRRWLAGLYAYFGAQTYWEEGK
jgi:sporulation protein YlmC with PRC-barrel domain